ASTDQSAIDMSISSLAWGFTYLVVQLFGYVAVMSQAAWQVIIVLIPVMAASICDTTLHQHANWHD
ncbi:ABC transporter C family member 3-like protein, partial [Trifolium pratense]